MICKSGRIKTEFAVLAVIIAGLTLLLLLRNPDRVKYELPEIPPLERSALDRIEIQSPKGKVVLQKESEKWRLQPSGHIVDETRINNALDALTSLELTTLVSRSGDDSRYGMEAESAIVVKAFAGDQSVRAFTLGKVASTYRHTFLRLPDDHGVYHAAGSLRSDFEYGAADWRDKSVLAFSPDEIFQLSVTAGDRNVTLDRSAAAAGMKSANREPAVEEAVAVAWKTTDGREVDSKTMDPLLRSLAELTCSEFIRQDAYRKADDIVLAVTLKGDREYHLELRRGEEKDGKRYTGTSSAVSEPFQLEEYTADELIRKAEAVFTSATETASSTQD